jgi:D-alanyl-lipoteichoic acid acyltransferase DltB (MBOAT superfamily)
MNFHTPAFAAFFLIVFTVFWAIHRWRVPRVLLLLGASYLFYMMGPKREYALLIVFQSVTDYYLAHLLVRLRNKRTRKLLVATSVVVNLGILAVFKYYDFFAESISALAENLGLPISVHTLNLVLPVGISFYTFHTLSYTLDVYYGKIPPARNLSEFALAVVFFPQLVAGPIVRAAQFLPQMENRPRFELEKVQSGLLLLFVGLFKKVLLADGLAELLVDPAFAQPGLASGPHLLLAVYGYAFQIYLDFSGYSDMAMGLARMLGYELPINFNLPYRATDMRDFWRRWHISLSTFLRDYLYIPLGGSKGGRWLTCRNLMLTMLLGGLWHGAAWTFVLWGAFHGALLVIQHLWQRGDDPAREESPVRWSTVWRVVLTFHLVCLGWVFFRAQGVESVGIILSRIAAWAPALGDAVIIRERGLWLLLLAVLLHYAPRPALDRVGDWVLARSPVVQGAMAAVVIGVFGIFASANHPFIYFQF